jgi:hypothetical protein
VVDDDSLTQTVMTRLFTRLGCKAENSEIALEMVLSGHAGRFAELNPLLRDDSSYMPCTRVTPGDIVEQAEQLEAERDTERRKYVQREEDGDRDGDSRR